MKYYLLTSLSLALLIFWPLHAPSSWYPMHDSTHLTRLALLTDTINSGQFPPIWAEGINQGYGYPLFHFYAPLFHFVAYDFHIVGFSLVVALKLTLFLATIIGAWGMLKWAGLVGAVAFILSPYGALNLYVRGAYSEYLALMVLPWVFLTLKHLGTSKQVIFASLTLSFFFLSHNLVPILATPLIIIWALANNPTRLKNLFLTALLAFGLTAWFLLPVLVERSFTQTDLVAKTTNYGLHFVSPAQIWNSTWGFGGSAPGVEDGMSFKLGKLQLLLAGLGVIMAIKKRSRIGLLLGFASLFYLYLATPLSRPLWDILPVLQMVQFPWRALGVSSVLLSWLVGYAVARILPRPFRLLISACLIGVFLALNLKYFSPQSIIVPPDISRDIASVVPEYMPRWMGNVPTTPALPLERAYYPTWKVLIDGHSVPTSVDESGILTYPNPDNSTSIQLIQSHTPLQKFAYAITLLTVLLTIIYAKH